MPSIYIPTLHVPMSVIAVGRRQNSSQVLGESLVRFVTEIQASAVVNESRGPRLRP